MNISKKLQTINYYSEKEKITTFSGLKHLADLARRLGICKELEALPLKKRQRGINISDHILSAAFNAVVGGDSFLDMQTLREEIVTRELCGGLEVPAPTTAGEFVRKFTLGTINALAAVNRRLVMKVYEKGPELDVKYRTFDFDSSICQIYGYMKEGASYGYTGEKGLHPQMMFDGDLRMLVHTRLRGGKRASGRKADSFIQECKSVLRTAARAKDLWLRLDAGFYDHKVAEECEKHGYYFSITAKLTKRLKREIEEIPDERWTKYRHESGAEWAEIRYQPIHWEKEYRMLIKRTPYYEKDQLILEKYFYVVVLTNVPGYGSGIVRHHFARGGAENYIEEFKNGFGGRMMPSQKFLANWAKMLMVQLGYNLVQAFKYLLLPEKAWPDQIKKLRLHWFCVAGRLVKTGHRLFVGLARGPTTVEKFLNVQAAIRII